MLRNVLEGCWGSQHQQEDEEKAREVGSRIFMAGTPQPPSSLDTVTAPRVHRKQLLAVPKFFHYALKSQECVIGQPRSPDWTLAVRAGQA